MIPILAWNGEEESYTILSRFARWRTWYFEFYIVKPHFSHAMLGEFRNSLWRFTTTKNSKRIFRATWKEDVVFLWWPWLCRMPQHALSHEFPWRPCSKLTMVFACKSAVPGRWLAFWMSTSCQSEAGYILVYWYHVFLIVSLKFRTFFCLLQKSCFFFVCWKIATWDSLSLATGFQTHIVLQEFVLLWRWIGGTPWTQRTCFDLSKESSEWCSWSNGFFQRPFRCIQETPWIGMVCCQRSYLGVSMVGFFRSSGFGHWRPWGFTLWLAYRTCHVRCVGPRNGTARDKLLVWCIEICKLCWYACNNWELDYLPGSLVYLLGGNP